jgi:hypothetical protein
LFAREQPPERRPQRVLDAARTKHIVGISDYLNSIRPAAFVHLSVEEDAEQRANPQNDSISLAYSASQFAPHSSGRARELPRAQVMWHFYKRHTDTARPNKALRRLLDRLHSRKNANFTEDVQVSTPE